MKIGRLVFLEEKIDEKDKLFKGLASARLPLVGREETFPWIANYGKFIVCDPLVDG